MPQVAPQHPLGVLCTSLTILYDAIRFDKFGSGGHQDALSAVGGAGGRQGWGQRKSSAQRVVCQKRWIGEVRPSVDYDGDPLQPIIRACRRQCPCYAEIAASGRVPPRVNESTRGGAPASPPGPVRGVWRTRDTCETRFHWLLHRVQSSPLPRQLPTRGGRICLPPRTNTEGAPSSTLFAQCKVALAPGVAAVATATVEH